MISDIQALESIGEDWLNLYKRCPDVTPFQSPDWLIPWWKHFGNGDLLVLAGYSGKRLAGLAPLYVNLNGEGKEVLFIGTGISDYLDFLCEPASAQSIASALLEHLWSLHGDWNLCNLQELRPQSPLLKGEPLFYPEGSLVQMGVCPVLNLPGNPEAYLQMMDPKQRRSLKRATSKLVSASVEKAAEDTVKPLMERLFFLHHKRWAGRNMPGVLEDPGIQEFHLEVAASFAARGSLELYALRFKGFVAAVLYGFCKAPRFYAYIAGFDPELESLSPGAVLIHATIARSISSGLRDYDFLRGGERYKYSWGAADTFNFQLKLVRDRMLFQLTPTP